MKISLLSFRTFRVLLFLALALPGFANDDMTIFSGVTQLNCNNGWRDWGWVPHYITNNPTWNGHYTMTIAPNGGYQAWYIEHDLIDTTIYDSISFQLNGGATGGQTVGLQAQAGANWGPQIQVTAPTNSWKQCTFSLSALGVNNITNLQAIEIWNPFSTTQPKFYVADVRLVAAPAPATVHVNVGTTQIYLTVSPDMLGVNQVAWDGAIATPTTVSLLNDMGDPCLRWPGGSWGDGYHWTNEAWMYGATNGRGIIYGDPPQHPHDRRDSGAYLDHPWPGYLVGGANPKATDWHDVQANYRVNEIAINWNAALVYALAVGLNN